MPARDIKQIAIVGYGNIARHHLEVFRSIGCEVIASCNRSKKNRDLARDQGGIQKTYASISEMLEKERPHGVVCCASYDSMYEAACEVLPFGIPTLLEKPPGLSRQNAVTLGELASKSGAPTMVGVNRRHYSVLRRAIENAGGKDAITAVFVDWSERPGVYLDRGDSPDAVERLVFANSLHALDTLIYLAGPVPKVQVIGLNRGQPFLWQMAMHGVSERNVLVSLTSTWDSPGRWGVSFCSSGRRYVFAPLETCSVFEDGLPDPWVIEPSDEDRQFKPGFLAQAAEFQRLMDTGATDEDYSIGSVLPAMDLAEKLTAACLEDQTLFGPPEERRVTEKGGA